MILYDNEILFVVMVMVMVICKTEFNLGYLLFMVLYQNLCYNIAWEKEIPVNVC